MTRFAELVAATNYSFLRGASHPSEIVEAAAACGLAAIGIADRNTLAGVVRAHIAAKEAKLRLVVGARLVTIDGFEVVAHPSDRAAYGRLCRLLTLGKRRAGSAECNLAFADILEMGGAQLFIVLPPHAIDTGFVERLGALAAAAPGAVHLGATFAYRGDERRRLGALAELAAECGTPLLATADALYHAPTRKILADVLTCIRETCTINDAGFRLDANAERHIKSGAEMARLFQRHPESVAQSLAILDRARFSLDELRYEYPDEPVPKGVTPQQHLEALAWERAAGRYPQGIPDKVAALLRKELALIAELDYAPYFLTVSDIVDYARGQGILCQGRGSAANSAVCYCLGITAVDPTKIDLLFERFVSAERKEPPDIDVDFEHERREEVIQYLYRRYGRERAAICSTVIHYRPRSTIREVGKALGLGEDIVRALAATTSGYGINSIPDDHIRDAGLDPDNPALRQALRLTHALFGFPRHLSQHVGGFVLTRERLDETVPIGNAAMEERTFIEWDKDDIDALGMLKVDVLALGMLTCIKRAFTLLAQHHGRVFADMAAVPQDDPAVYEMLSRADSVGVFQVESRAQMSMLPRLRPRSFYDLVIEVAIVRPGPIQGDMVHPYLRRRAGLEPVDYPSPALKAVLEKTFGVPLFQEQVMQIAIVAAGFTPGEADKLRRAMATFRHSGTIYGFRDKFVAGMLGNGYRRDFAERCFNQIEGFGEYGFPESHAASFALLVYVSAWIKRHYPDVFCAAILNSQPMGFYRPAQLVRDAREHGIEVRPPDVAASDWDCTLESGLADGPNRAAGISLFSHPVAAPTLDARTLSPVRLGLRLISGLSRAHAEAIIAARAAGDSSPRALWLVSGVPLAAVEKLADADAFRSLGLDRRAALWAVKGLADVAPDGERAARPLPILAAPADLFSEAPVTLPRTTPGQHVVQDYVTLGLSLKAHPCVFLREDFMRRGVITSAAHRDERMAGRMVSVAGLVLVRQRPGTAKGVVFMTLEDETGVVNVIIWAKVFAAHRLIIMTSQLALVHGRVQREGLVIHVVAETLIDLTAELSRLRDDDAAGPAATLAPPSFPRSHDFH